MVAASELPIDTGATAVEMAQNIFGSGVVVTGATFSGDNDSSGIYTANVLGQSRAAQQRRSCRTAN